MSVLATVQSDTSTPLTLAAVDYNDQTGFACVRLFTSSSIDGDGHPLTWRVSIAVVVRHTCALLDSQSTSPMLYNRSADVESASSRCCVATLPDLAASTLCIPIP